MVRGGGGGTGDAYIEKGYRECVAQAYRTMAAAGEQTRLFGKGGNNGLGELGSDNEESLALL